MTEAARVAGALSSSQLAFYATAATVMPVLLLALAVRGSTALVISHIANVEHVTRGVATVVKWLALALLALMVAGELLALLALKNDQVESGTWAIVFLGLLVAWLAVVIDVLGRVFSQIDRLVVDPGPARKDPPG